MKKSYLLPGIFALVTCLGISLACSKSVDVETVTNDATVTLLVSHPWKIKEIKVPSQNTPVSDSIISQSCHTSDAVIQFSLSGPDGLFSFADNTPGACDSTVFPYDHGNWGLKVTKDSLLFAGQKTTYRSMKLVAITQDSLQVNYVDSAITPHLVKTITFIK